jgi:hypothetical protein
MSYEPECSLVCGASTLPPHLVQKIIQFAETTQEDTLFGLSFSQFVAVPAERAVDPTGLLELCYSRMRNDYLASHTFLRESGMPSFYTRFQEVTSEYAKMLDLMDGATKIELYAQRGTEFYKSPAVTWTRGASLKDRKNPYLVISDTATFREDNSDQYFFNKWPTQCLFYALSTSPEWACTVHVKIPMHFENPSPLYWIRMLKVFKMPLLFRPAPSPALSTLVRGIAEKVAKETAELRTALDDSIKKRLQLQEAAVEEARHTKKRVSAK